MGYFIWYGLSSRSLSIVTCRTSAIATNWISFIAQSPASIRWIVFLVIMMPFSCNWAARPFWDIFGKFVVRIRFMFRPAMFTLLYFFGIVVLFFFSISISPFLTLFLGYFIF